MAAEGLSTLHLYISKDLLKREDLEEAVEEEEVSFLLYFSPLAPLKTRKVCLLKPYVFRSKAKMCYDPSSQRIRLLAKDLQEVDVYVYGRMNAVYLLL